MRPSHYTVFMYFMQNCACVDLISVRTWSFNLVLFRFITIDWDTLIYVSVRTDLSLICPEMNTRIHCCSGHKQAQEQKSGHGGNTTVCKNGKQACIQEAIRSCCEEMRFVLLAFRSGESKLWPAGEIRYIIEIVVCSNAGTDVIMKILETIQNF